MTCGKLPPKRRQRWPPSTVTYTPSDVPTHSTLGFRGLSNTVTLPRSAGRPATSSVHVRPKSVERHTCGR